MKESVDRPGNCIRRSRSGSAWYAAVLLLGLVVGLGLNAGAVPESPGRWQPDGAKAAALEENWIQDYLAVRPRVGDHISSNLYVALAEGEHAWAAAYLARQQTALSRVIERSAPTGISGAQALLRSLGCYKRALSSDSFVSDTALLVCHP